MARKKSSQTSPDTIHVDIVSDIVCPWCWLGTRYLHQALEEVKKNDPKTKVTLTWRPYMLDPNVPAEGMAYRDYMKSKFGNGPNNRFKAMREHLEAAAPEAGIKFRFNDIPMRPNTLKAHLLMKWAQGQDKGDLVAEALFKAFFEDLRDVGDSDVIIDIAKEIGLDTDIVSDLLAQNKDSDKIMAEIDYFRGLGISGVPSFIYNGSILIQGAQPAQTHIKAIEKAAQSPVEIY